MVFEHAGGNKSHVLGKMHSATVKVNNIIQNCYFPNGILIYVAYVTVSVGQIFVQAILICSICIQQAHNMKKLSKMIYYCHFSVAENTIS